MSIAQASCPACDTVKVHAIDSWPMHAKRTAVACDECGLLFVHPQPTQEELAAHYAPGGKWQIKKQRPVNPAIEALLSAAHLVALSTFDRHFRASEPATGSQVMDYGWLWRLVKHVPGPRVGDVWDRAIDKCRVCPA